MLPDGHAPVRLANIAPPLISHVLRSGAVKVGLVHALLV